MACKDVNVKGGRVDLASLRWPIGEAFVYQTSIWKIKGLYFTANGSGQRELWWIVGEHRPEGSQQGGEV